MTQTTRLISRSEAVAAGVTDDHLRRHGRRLFRGQWVLGDGDVTRHHLHAAALAAAGSGAFLTHESAALSLGGVVPATDTVHVGVLGDRRLRTPGLTVHRYHRAPVISTVRGLPVCAAGFTMRDLAARLALVDLVVCGDALAHRLPHLLPDFARAIATTPGRGSVRARAAAELIRTEAESPYETRTRLLLTFAGLPSPQLQHPICNEFGAVVYRLDMAYPDVKLAIEYDGLHHQNSAQKSRDLIRREDLERAGWHVVVVVASDLHQQPDLLLHRVCMAMRLVGMNPPRLSEHWRLHFAGR